ncbi:MAG: hypothetical protein ACI4S9_00350 [Christensenellales bacterium]
MKKFRIATTVFLVSLMCILAVSCGTEPVLPKVNITSGDASITTNETYTLVYEVQDAESESVVVTEKSGKSTGSYDKDTKKFSASDEGEYTITVTVKNGEKTATASVKITVTIPVDDVAPVITISGEKQYTIAAGGSVTLPTATAIDEVDGDLTDELYIYCLSGNTFSSIKDGVFSSNVAGVHEVLYYSEDKSGNEATETVIITVTAATAEDNAVENYNDIENLNSDGGIFKENFEKMQDSPLIKNALAGHTVMSATEQAIAGNSIIIDYTTLEGKENRWFLSNIMPFLRSGKWQISFDVKLVSGTAFSDFYFGYGKNGETSSTDTQYSLAGMTVGQVKRISYSQILDLDENGEYFFHMFKLSQTNNMDCVLAFDNFEIKYSEFNYQTYVPTVEELKAGMTYDWENTYMGITSAEPVKVEDIEDSAARAAISGASEGFGNTVMHLNGNGSFEFSAILLDLNQDFYPIGYRYVISFSYYCVSKDSNYFIAFDGTSGNAVVDNGFLTVGLGEFSIDAEIKANWYKMCLYGSMELYMGNMSIRLVEKDPESPYTDRTDYHAATMSELTAEGGYTFDYSADNYLNFTNTQNAEIALLPGDLKTAMTDANGFSENAVYLKVAQNSSGGYIFGLSGLFSTDYDYTISFNTYEVASGDLTVLMMSQATGGQNSQYNFTRNNVSGNVYRYTVSFNPKSGDDHLLIYNVGAAAEIYFGDITVSASEHQVAAITPNGHTVGKKWTISAESFYGPGDTGGTLIDTPAALASEAGFGGDKVRTYEMSAEKNYNVYNLAGNNIIESCGVYKITVYYNVADASGATLFINFDNAQFVPIDASNGTHAAVIENVVSRSYLSLYSNAGTSNSIIGSIEVELTAIN